MRMAYASGVGNAGTGFRYRARLVLLGLPALVALREHSLRTAPATGDGAHPTEQTVTKLALAGRGDTS